jgi:hypothetical protein
MLMNKYDIIERLVNKALSANSENNSVEIKLTDNHGDVVAYESLNIEDIEVLDVVTSYTNVFEYMSVVDHTGSDQFDEDSEYKPDENTLSDVSNLIGSPFDYSGVELSVDIVVDVDSDFKF